MIAVTNLKETDLTETDDLVSSNNQSQMLESDEMPCPLFDTDSVSFAAVFVFEFERFVKESYQFK